jgi:hypothetical protein
MNYASVSFGENRYSQFLIPAVDINPKATPASRPPAWVLPLIFVIIDEINVSAETITAPPYGSPWRVFLVRSVTFTIMSHGHKNVINRSNIGSISHFL